VVLAARGPVWGEVPVGATVAPSEPMTALRP
jgi:hypothetical protein